MSTSKAPLSSLGTERSLRDLIGDTRTLLLIGFGGLLALMGFGAIQTEFLLRQIEARNSGIQQGFLARSRTLTEIRSDLFLSGTLFRDYVLDPEASRSESQRRRLDHLHRSMDQRLDEYERLLPHEEEQTFQQLKLELNAYWRLLGPALNWDAERRQQEGYAFLRDEVFPRRTAVLTLADQVAALNEKQLLAGGSQVAELFAGFRNRVRLTLLGGMVLGLGLALIAARRILHLEQDASAKYEQVEHARSELRELSAKLVEAQEVERRSISRELHDEVGQSLSAVLMEVNNLNAALRQGQDVEPHVSSIKRMTEGSVQVVRNLSLLLRPSMLDDLGLVAALEWQAREISRRMEVDVDIEEEGVREDLPDQHKTCVYRVVQEALHNASRHAGARMIKVRLRQRPGRLSLTVQDDGHGFDALRSKGLGLLGMEERVTTLGGTFALTSNQKEGTTIAISLPLPEEQA